MQNQRQIIFSITDSLSGIESIAGYIDNSWALFEYDPKSHLVFYEFDNSRIGEDKEHNVKIIAVDRKNNKTRFSCKFYW
jgi:hypothetical protein